MMTTRDYMVEARDLIAQKRYDEAREILVEIDHPTARKWLAKLDEIDPPLLDDPFADSDEPEPIRPKRKSPTDKGELLGQFGVNVLEFIRRLVVGLPIILLAGMLLHFGLIEGGNQDNRGFFIAFSLAFFLMGAYQVGSLLYVFLIDRKTLIYQWGIERKTLRGLHFHSFEEIESVNGNLTVTYVYFFPVFSWGAYQFRNGDKVLFKVDSLDQRHSELYGYLCQKIEETHKARLLKEYRSGKTLHFKPIELRGDGLHHGKKHLPLDDMGGFEISEGIISIHKKNDKVWKRYTMDELHNPWLLESVVTTLTKH